MFTMKFNPSYATHEDGISASDFIIFPPDRNSLLSLYLTLLMKLSFHSCGSAAVRAELFDSTVDNFIRIQMSHGAMGNKKKFKFILCWSVPPRFSLFLSKSCL